MRQPWIHGAALDGAFVLAPSFLVTALVLLFPGFFEGRPVTAIAWVLLVLCIDVSHVYGSLYRTYFSRAFAREHGALLVAVPVLCWGAGAALYLCGPVYFWSALAYLAVFHFVRQQYGFLRIYSREEPEGPGRRLDAAVIYLATLYPLSYWHAHLPRKFHWLIEGDFFPGLPNLVPTLLGWLYAAAALAYVVREARKPLNWPKQLLVLGTATSWYVGIIVLNGDLAFTITNVVAHGIPYLALVWASGRRESRAGMYALAMIPAFLGVLLLFAYVEEGLWDGLVWREHEHVFPWFRSLPAITDSLTLALLAPLLALPQSTHYVLDGFVWRGKRKTARSR